MKKYLAFLLALVLCFGLCACGGNTAAEDTQPTEPEQPKVEDDGIMKILLIGHSLGNDSSYMFPDVYRNEGNENLIMGVLYHSVSLGVVHMLTLPSTPTMNTISPRIRNGSVLTATATSPPMCPAWPTIPTSTTAPSPRP